MENTETFESKLQALNRLREQEKKFLEDSFHYQSDKMQRKFKQEVIQTSDSIESIKDTIVVLQQDEIEANREQKLIKDTVRKYKDELSQTNKSLKTAHDALETIREKIEQDSYIENQIVEVKAKLDKTTIESKSQRDELTALQSDYGKAKIHLESSAKEIKKLHHMMSHMKHRETTLVSENGNLKSKLKNTVAKMEASFEKQIKKIVFEKERLQVENTQLSEDLENCKDEMDAYRAEKSEFEKKLENSIDRDAFEELTTRYVESQAMLDRLKSPHRSSELHSLLDRKTKEVQHLQNRNKKLQKELAETKQQSQKSLTQMKSQYDKKVKKLKSEWSMSMRKVKEARKESVRFTKEFSNTKETIAKEYDELMKELINTREEFAKLEEKLGAQTEAMQNECESVNVLRESFLSQIAILEEQKKEFEIKVQESGSNQDELMKVKESLANKTKEVAYFKASLEAAMKTQKIDNGNREAMSKELEHIKKEIRLVRDSKKQLMRKLKYTEQTKSGSVDKCKTLKAQLDGALEEVDHLQRERRKAIKARKDLEHELKENIQDLKKDLDDKAKELRFSKGDLIDAQKEIDSLKEILSLERTNSEMDKAKFDAEIQSLQENACCETQKMEQMYITQMEKSQEQVDKILSEKMHLQEKIKYLEGALQAEKEQHDIGIAHEKAKATRINGENLEKHKEEVSGLEAKIESLKSQISKKEKSVARLKNEREQSERKLKDKCAREAKVAEEKINILKGELDQTVKEFKIKSKSAKRLHQNKRKLEKENLATILELRKLEETIRDLESKFQSEQETSKKLKRRFEIKTAQLQTLEDSIKSKDILLESVQNMMKEQNKLIEEKEAELLNQTQIIFAEKLSREELQDKLDRAEKKLSQHVPSDPKTKKKNKRKTPKKRESKYALFERAVSSKNLKD